MENNDSINLMSPIKNIWGIITQKYGERHPKWLISRVYKHLLGREIDWDNPEDLNEKINWLKLHSDPLEWSRLADKYRVREFVKEKGLEQILIPLYGHWNSASEVIEDWDKLPDEFVLKCNNGNGRVRIVSRANGGKESVDLQELQAELENWVSSKYGGVAGTEPHYSLIQNCIIAEKLLHDESEKNYSDSVVDYKIWCFDGEPYGCFVCYNRNIKTKEKDVLFYDLEWNAHPEVFVEKSGCHDVMKPEKWEQMLKIASELSAGHPQVRVDLYYSGNNIYFGEMTMTARGGFMTVYTREALLKMGNEITLDLTTPGNIFCR